MSTQLKGEAITLQSKEITRSSQPFFFTTHNEDIDGKFVFYDTLDTRLADHALSFAMVNGARALLARHEPDTLGTIPIILSPPELFSFIENLPNPPKVTVVPLTASYTAVNVELRTQQEISTNAAPAEWSSKMFIPTTLFKKTTNSFAFDYMIDATPFLFRDRCGKIDSDAVSDGDRLSNKICLFNTTRPDDADCLVELATKLGASLLILCGKETPDFTKITLPVINIDSDKMKHLQRAGLKSGENADESYLCLHISYGNGVEFDLDLTEPERKEDPPGPNVNSKEPKGFFQWGRDVMANAIGFYSPFSKKEFAAIISAGGTLWSLQGQAHHSYQKAQKILSKIDCSVDSLDKKKKEIESLVEAIVEMTKSENFVGDIMVLLFCHHLTTLRAKFGIKTPTELLDAMCTVSSKCSSFHFYSRQC